MSHEHPFAPYVRILGKGRRGSRPLTYEEAYEAMSMILRGEVEDVQLGAVMMLLRVKEENGDELAGFAQASRCFIQNQIPSTLKADIDWSSYAGKRRQLPWFLLASFALADAGYKVFMHGANGHTIGRIYTSEVLAHFGIPSAENWQQCQIQLEDNGFSFMSMAQLCPELQRIIDLRNTFGLRSPVHSFSRLLNPLNAPYVTQGVFHPGYGPSHQSSAEKLGYQRLSIIKGEGGECEVNPDAVFKMHHCFEGKLIEEDWPALFEKRHVKPSQLSLDDLKQLWENKLKNEYATGAVLGTLAYVARLIGKGDTQQACLAQAEQWWRNRHFDRFRYRS